MLNYEIWGNSVQTWIVSLLIIAGAFIVVKLLSLLGRKVIKPFIGRTNNRVDDIIYYSLESPLKFAVMLLGIWIAMFADWAARTAFFVPRFCGHKWETMGLRD